MVLTCVLEDGVADMDLERFHLVSVALSTRLPHAPHLLREALDFFATGPSIFDPILASPSRLASDADELGRRRLVCAHAAYRLLRLSDKFRALWDWSPLFALLRDASVQCVSSGFTWCLVGL